jgi:hypothetical protein
MAGRIHQRRPDAVLLCGEVHRNEGTTVTRVNGEK